MRARALRPRRGVRRPARARRLLRCRHPRRAELPGRGLRGRRSDRSRQPADARPARTARQIVAQLRPVPDDLKLGCRDGRSLVVRGDNVACVPSADVCPRGREWDATSAPLPLRPPCAPGEVRRHASSGADDGGDCARVVTPSRDGAPVVDVGRWLRAMLGTDGGEGTARVCRPLSQQVGELDVGPGGRQNALPDRGARLPGQRRDPALGEGGDGGPGLRTGGFRRRSPGGPASARRPPGTAPGPGRGVRRGERDGQGALHRPRRGLSVASSRGKPCSLPAFRPLHVSSAAQPRCCPI